MARLLRKVAGGAAALLVLWGAGKLALKVVDPVHEGALAPAFALDDVVTGEPIALKDFKGKVLVLDFWATWCPPCQEELPELAALAKDQDSRGVKVLGVLIPPFDGPPIPTGMPYPSVRVEARMRAAYGGIHAVPTTFVIDRKGRVAKRFVGGLTREVLQPELDRLL